MKHLHHYLKIYCSNSSPNIGLFSGSDPSCKLHNHFARTGRGNRIWWGLLLVLQYSAVCVFLQMMMAAAQPGMGKWKMLPISGNIIICFSAITILNTNYDSPRGIHYRLPHHFPITLAGSQKAVIYQLNVFPFTRPHSEGCTTHSVIGKMCLCGSTSCDECMRSREMKGGCRSFAQWSIKVSEPPTTNECEILIGTMRVRAEGDANSSSSETINWSWLTEWMFMSSPPTLPAQTDRQTSAMKEQRALCFANSPSWVVRVSGFSINSDIFDSWGGGTSLPEDNSINGLITLVENRIVPRTD